MDMENSRSIIKYQRPDVIKSSTVRMNTGCGNLYVTVGRGESNELVEVLAALGKSGSCAKCFNEALTRMITLSLKYSVPVKEIVDELSGIRCPSPSWDRSIAILSCPDAISKALFAED